jgi:uncharacterized Zn-binding protein involved in type VI secretion
MAMEIVVVGNQTSHGGRVVNGSDIHAIGGKSIARLNDLVDCSQKYPDGCPHGVNKIIEAHPAFTIGGKQAALHGHHSECGCTLIASATASAGD